MEKDYQQEYINLSTDFRVSNESEESVSKLYDLLYELEKIERTKQENLILSNLYTLLGFHQSAYEVYKPIANLENRKELTKLYTLEQKAKSHGNHLFIKNILKLRVKNEPTKFLPKDFEIDKNKITTRKNIVIFNKIVEQDRFEINICENHNFENFQAKVIDHLSWLSDCRKELTNFYNTRLSEVIDRDAARDWYDILEILNVKIFIEENGKLFTEISAGDIFLSDHILDIEIEERKIISMNYDG